MKASTKTKVSRAQKQKTEHPFNDLCTTCLYAEDCKAAKNRKSAIYYCEEFETPSLTGIQFGPGRTPTVDRPPIEPGICVNCENHATCTIEKPESGIWHCDEYA